MGIQDKTAMHTAKIVTGPQGHLDCDLCLMSMLGAKAPPSQDGMTMVDDVLLSGHIVHAGGEFDVTRQSFCMCAGCLWQRSAELMNFVLVHVRFWKQ